MQENGIISHQFTNEALDAN